MSLTNDPETDSVHSLTDLENWKFEGVSLAVIGHPIAHSISPSMHNAALSVMSDDDARFSHWRYFKFDILPEDLASALPIFYQKKFIGLNLGLPHKVEAVPLIAKIDPAAQRVGAVNNLHWQDDGYHGYNTDGYGLEKAIHHDLDAEFKDAPLFSWALAVRVDQPRFNVWKVNARNYGSAIAVKIALHHYSIFYAPTDRLTK